MRKAIILCFIVIGVSITDGYSQTVTERKYSALKTAEKGIFNLGFGIDTVSHYIYPEIVGQRSVLAPHYPDITSLERTVEAITLAFHNWIESYPTEYEAYYTYLQNFITSNR